MSKIDEKELYELFIEIKHGNVIGFNKLYDRYKNLVYSIAFSILKNKDDSDDIVQSVFSKIYSLPKTKLPSDHFGTWLYSITKNEAISLFRKNKNTVDIDSLYEIADTDNEINNLIDKMQFNKLISRLNNNEKEIVSLKILTNLTFEEIAKMMNKPTSTIKWKYYKSIHTLRLLLSNLGMFILTFVIGLKTMKLSQKEIADYQSNSLENKTNGENEQQSNQAAIEESTQYNSSVMQDRIEEKNIANNDEQTKEEIQVPVNEPINNINYFGVGILCISSIFLLFSIILIITFIKSQLKIRTKSSK